MQSEQDALLTVRDVAEILKVPTTWVYEHTRRACAHRLPVIKVGKYLRFIAADITAYVEASRDGHAVGQKSGVSRA